MKRTPISPGLSEALQADARGQDLVTALRERAEAAEAALVSLTRAEGHMLMCTRPGCLTITGMRPCPKHEAERDRAADERNRALAHRRAELQKCTCERCEADGPTGLLPLDGRAP